MATQSKKTFTEADIEEAFKKEMPYFYELQSMLNKIPDGQVQLTVRMYKGDVQDYIVTTSVKKRVYSK